MVSVDISLTPSLSGATLPLSLSLNKRILGDFMGLCFFGRIRSDRKEGVTRIPESTHGRPGATAPGFQAFTILSPRNIPYNKNFGQLPTQSDTSLALA